MLGCHFCVCYLFVCSGFFVCVVVSDIAIIASIRMVAIKIGIFDENMWERFVV